MKEKKIETIKVLKEINGIFNKYGITIKDRIRILTIYEINFIITNPESEKDIQLTRLECYNDYYNNNLIKVK